ncbi:MAG TPA: phytoene desaturase family protein [Bacteroidia bacterium]|nr:phytoene desaturase family protein [Bacteroidia bacterium]HNU32503.1 phytoene desaturase family protein [Bacteroidia bacterium]
MQKKKAIIIGSGLGGLATALRLSVKGFEVEILEKYHQPGGRLNQLQKDGFTFDVGPSFFSMSYEFTELFDYCGIKNPLQLNELNPLYAVYFEGKEKPFLIYKNLELLQKEFAGIEDKLIEKTEKYLSAAGNLFHDSIDKVVRRNFNSKFDYFLSLATVPLKHSPKMFRSMWKELEMNFNSEEVKVIFSLVAFFLGSTPFQTPAVYSLLNYTELKHDGYWNVQGGMYKIVEEMVTLLKQRNVKFQFNVEVKEIRSSAFGVRSVVAENGKEYFADLFICNSDAASFRGKVLNREKFSEQKLDKMEWTLSPFTIYLGVKGKCENLHHHNYFLGNNFKEYADTIFKTSVNPQKPYYYVNVSSKSNTSCAPEGCENIFILCPVPDLRYKPNWNDSQQLADNIISDLSSRINFDLHKNTLTKTIMNPVDWQNSFNLYRGSGLGLAHGLNQIGGFRPKNKDEEFSNLYYVGASTIPGTGLPMVVISSKLVSERILNTFQH